MFLQQKELVLYPDKDGSVQDLLNEAKKQMTLTTEKGGSGRLRLLEVISYKILGIKKEETSLNSLNPPGSKVFRIEQIPEDEDNLAEDEFLVPVAHFHKVCLILFLLGFLRILKD